VHVFEPPLNSFQKHLPGVEIVTCNKVRTAGNKREVVISDGDPSGKHVLIMDDLIQTGGTLYECAVTLKKANAASMSGFVVHAVFPGGGYKRFLKGGDRCVFDRFWLTSSNPAICGDIPSGDVIEVLDLTPSIVHDLEGEPSGRAAWS
jgi:phosphoribosylpyrophosphate synthetase